MRLPCAVLADEKGRGGQYIFNNCLPIYDCGILIGAIIHLKEQIRAAARTTSPVLIEGETGCGKELVAGSIHDLSIRSYNPFVKINCSAVPDDLAESEFFGYEYGAFTGARKQGKPGLFETANKGSLFLDEIHQMSWAIQPKLLRALQEREIRHVGGNKAIPIDTRIIASSNKPLYTLVEKGVFREDLYYRLRVRQRKTSPYKRGVTGYKCSAV